MSPCQRTTWFPAKCLLHCDTNTTKEAISTVYYTIRSSTLIANNKHRKTLGRFQRPQRAHRAINLWNSTRPPRPVSGSIQTVPNLDVNQANVGTQCLQVAHDNTLQEPVVGRVSSLSFRHCQRFCFSLDSHYTLKKIFLPSSCAFVGLV